MINCPTEINILIISPLELYTLVVTEGTVFNKYSLFRPILILSLEDCDKSLLSINLIKDALD
jgi:hypothetical protein